ncbi:hypothetical protein HG535_0F03200 [Zygotorulaspora mrakii]|uniref:Uncharacterized protein n=1 Tax=Zygotorulaspora mrakii TaxID=42260 RepID=A0A7H9B784_ZYGMR|nr:uncharacterized protein HG535_0F03200 [Zygotorulaspora mrakii]QLG73809.1 hypothetical protein HG535_0F03200 [Zygotorulaspora mrakii]
MYRVFAPRVLATDLIVSELFPCELPSYKWSLSSWPHRYLSYIEECYTTGHSSLSRLSLVIVSVTYFYLRLLTLLLKSATETHNMYNIPLLTVTELKSSLCERTSFHQTISFPDRIARQQEMKKKEYCLSVRTSNPALNRPNTSSSTSSLRSFSHIA